MPVRRPLWAGAAGEMAVVVSRGEPRRSDLQMEQAVAGQVRDYLLHYSRVKVTDVLVAVTVQLIAQDYITPDGSQGVTLTREHLLAFAKVAKEKVSTLMEGQYAS